MENLADYSNYVVAAYAVAIFAILALATFTLRQYFYIKKRINEK